MGIFDSVKTLIGKPAVVPTTNQTAAVSQPSKKILIIEDDPAIRQLYSEILTGEGYQITVAENGQVGLDSIKTQHPDLIMLDLMMPVMDGKTMLHQLRAIPEFAKLPVIVLTNAGDVESMRSAKFFDNANEFLIKSNVTPQDIVQKVKSLLP